LSKERLAEQLETETVKIPDAEKAKILDSFYGYTTWDAIKNQINGVKFKSKEDIPV
jgi:hypothetical protein